MSYKTTNTDVAAAIDRSSSYDEIVTITVDSKEEAKAIRAELQDATADGLECDSVDTGSLIEVWAYDPETDDGSMAWRVHVQYS